MHQRRQEFEEADIVLVTFTDPDNLPSYQDQHNLALTMVTDSDRSAYQAFGLGRGAVTRVWGLKAARSYFKILLSSGFAGLRTPNEDSLQLGGDFVIDPAGNLVYGFWSDGPDERPSVDDLLEALHSSRQDRNSQSSLTGLEPVKGVQEKQNSIQKI